MSEINAAFDMNGNRVINMAAGESPTDGATKGYVDTLVGSSAGSTNVYFGPISGNDDTGTGTRANPFKSATKANAYIMSQPPELLPGLSTNLGPQRNPAVSYTVVMIEPGVSNEDPSWAPLLYVNYTGLGQDQCVIQHSDNSPIVFHYGDNYGDGQTFQGLNLIPLQVIRTAGYNDLSTQPNLWEIDFDDCNVRGLTFKGSGFDGGPFLAGGLPAFNADRIVMKGCTANGNVNLHAVQMQFANCALGNIIMDYVGVDGSIPYSGAYVNTTTNCTINRMDLKNYITMNVYNSKKNGFRIFGLNPDTVYNDIFGINPIGYLDADSIGGPSQLRTNAIPQQIQPITSLPNLAQNLVNEVVSGTVALSGGENNILADTSGGAVDITLAPAVNFGQQVVADVKNNAGTNNITVRPTALDIMMEGGVQVASSVISSNGGKKTFVFTGDGGGGGTTKSSSIVCRADSGGDLAGQYIQIYSITGVQNAPGLPLNTIQFVPYFIVSGVGNDPALPGTISVPVAINTNDTADAVAAALLAACQQSQLANNPNFGPAEFADFEPGASNEVTQANYVNGNPPDNTTAISGFVLSVTSPGAYDMNGTVWVI